MAARIDRIHNERVRARIRTSQLVRALQDNVLGRNYINGKAGTVECDKDFLSEQQVRCAIALLAKCLPDLQRSEITGPDGETLNVTVLRFVHEHSDTEQLDSAPLPVARLVGP